MEKLWQKFKNDKFVIIAVNIREGKEMVKSFMKEKGYTFPVLLDSKGEVARTYGIRAIPTTFLIDVEGKIMGVDKISYLKEIGCWINISFLPDVFLRL